MLLFPRSSHFLSGGSSQTGTSDSQKDWFAVGEYKKLPNEVGGKKTVEPARVSENIKQLLDE